MMQLGFEKGRFFKSFVLRQFGYITSSGFMSDSQIVRASCLSGCSEDLGKGFWQQWQQYRDYLYRCCIKWMGGNPTDAEDALSRAMLKALNVLQTIVYKTLRLAMLHNPQMPVFRVS
jgi:hypothetical protein